MDNKIVVPKLDRISRILQLWHTNQPLWFEKLMDQTYIVSTQGLLPFIILEEELFGGIQEVYDFYAKDDKSKPVPKPESLKGSSGILLPKVCFWNLTNDTISFKQDPNGDPPEKVQSSFEGRKVSTLFGGKEFSSWEPVMQLAEQLLCLFPSHDRALESLFEQRVLQRLPKNWTLYSKQGDEIDGSRSTIYAVWDSVANVACYFSLDFWWMRLKIRHYFLFLNIQYLQNPDFVQFQKLSGWSGAEKTHQAKSHPKFQELLAKFGAQLDYRFVLNKYRNNILESHGFKPVYAQDDKSLEDLSQGMSKIGIVDQTNSIRNNNNL